MFLGNTKGTLQRNIIEPLQALFGTKLVSNISSDNTATIFGEKVHCLGASKINQVDVLRGASIKYCYGDEVVTWHEDVFRMLQSRLDKEYSRCDLTCNPDSPLHWFYNFLSSKADIYLQEYQLDDNIFLPEAFRESLKTEYAGTVWYDRYILGKWVLAEGLIYPQFRKDIHIVDNVPPCDMYYLTMDYGIQNPFACYLAGIKDGTVYYIDEYYYSGRETNRPMTDEQYYNEMDKMANSYYNIMRNRDVIMEAVIDPSASSMISVINNHDKYAVRKGDNDVIAGIQTTAKLFNTNRLFISSKCQRLIQELQVYSWDKEAKEDKPIKQNDHGCDAIRYLNQTIIAKGNAVSFT